MSWQLGSFLLLAAGLGAGFLWYERTHPDARIVASVGTMAAFAALGRIAFAAIPNVKPTTDIVLIAGLTLGGAPGYVVGAVAALTSNFFFGQGPWTPWQMAGWGLVGIAGAALSHVPGSRRLRRLPLAVICFVIGFGFTALQDVGDWFNYSDHSLGQLGIYVGKGLGFDLVHACGCFAFALAFGPALIRALGRFRQRLEVDWRPSGGAALVPAMLAAVCLALSHTGTAHAAAPRAGTPLSYLRSAQNGDGGFGPARGQSSTPMYTAWAVMASAGGARALHYLAATLQQDTDPGSVERTILAVAIAGGDPTRFGGVDLIAKLRRAIRPDGSVAEQSNLTSFAILALRSAHQRVSARSVAWLAAQQDADGGFNYGTRGAISDVDDTGAVLEALAGTGHTGLVERAVAFIRRQQNADGGFPGFSHGPSNAQSTAFAVQGLIAAGVSPQGVESKRGTTPIDYLKSLIRPNGAVNYAISNHQTPVWVTAQVELALVGRVL
ncbi:MAG TPA: prenyltransferase/squalene oxidase repeat-containing protein [Solirubrobacteraceae bacterium]|nr:prenyltransferase/squalene oxidase repeat-containing protein [Solirubrobacteraceae bacterium]